MAFLRVYYADSVPTDRRWFWVASDGHGSLGSGYAVDQKEAARLAVKAWKGRPDGAP